jgi:hypothetical protein
MLGVSGSFAILAVLLGAILGGAGRIVFDYYERIQTRRGIAAAIAGEISGILNEAVISEDVKHMRELIEWLEGPKPPTWPWIHAGAKGTDTPVQEAYVGRIGELGANAARKVAQWYALHLSACAGYESCGSEMYKDSPEGAAQELRLAMELWQRIEKDGQELVAELDVLSGYS